MLNYIYKLDDLKAELDSLRPISEQVLGEIRRFYRVGLTYSSNALEGNSLSEIETKIVLEDGITIGGKPLRDHLEAVGHGEALDNLWQLIQHSQQPATEATIQHWHALILRKIQPEQAGQYRRQPVFITGTDFLPPQADTLNELMTVFVSDKLPRWQASCHPVDVAALAHLELVSIHPFVDGNGRTARLLMNALLVQAGFAVTHVPLVLRSDYMAALRHVQSKPFDETSAQPFLTFIQECVHEGMKDYLRLLRYLLN